MKHLQNFEGFDLFKKNSIHFPFFHRRKADVPEVDVVQVPEVDVVHEDEVEEIPVKWTGAYDYKGKSIMLEIGDFTNKGEIIKIIPDISTTYITTEGGFNPEELIVYKGSEDVIKRFLDIKKYNI